MDYPACWRCLIGHVWKMAGFADTFNPTSRLRPCQLGLARALRIAPQNVRGVPSAAGVELNQGHTASATWHILPMHYILIAMASEPRKKRSVGVFMGYPLAS